MSRIKIAGKTIVGNDGTVKVGVSPAFRIYAFVSNIPPVDEGSSSYFLLQTSNVPDGTQIPYTITGVTELDIDIPLTGNFTMLDNEAEVNFTVLNNNTVEGTRTITITLDGINPTVTTSTEINDITPYYNIVFHQTDQQIVTNVDESSLYICTLQTLNVDALSEIYYEITGISENDFFIDSGIPPLNGRVLVGQTGFWTPGIPGSEGYPYVNTTIIEFTPNPDLLLEGAETMIVSISSITPSLTAALTSGSLIINDTSFELPTYEIGRSLSTVDEGSSVTFTLSTTNVADGTVLPYTITGISANDVTDGSLTGSFTISNDRATAIITMSADQLTEGAETATLTLNDGAASNFVLVNDTSMTPLPPPPLGAVISYDTTDSASYDGTGSTLNNLFNITPSLTGVIVNSPSYSSLTKSFTWNSTSYVSSKDVSSFFPEFEGENNWTNSPIALEVWAFPTKSNCVITSTTNEENPNAGGFHASTIDIVDGKAAFRLLFGAQLEGSTTVTLNTWHQFVLTYDGSVMRGYLDGQLQGTSGSFNRYAWPSSPGNQCYLHVGAREDFAIGPFPIGTSRFEGRWGAVSLYNTTKSTQWVLDSYNTNISKFA